MQTRCLPVCKREKDQINGFKHLSWLSDFWTDIKLGERHFRVPTQTYFFFLRTQLVKDLRKLRPPCKFVIIINRSNTNYTYCCGLRVNHSVFLTFEKSALSSRHTHGILHLNNNIKPHHHHPVRPTTKLTAWNLIFLLQKNI